MNNITSPQTTDESIERILRDHSPAPRVTLAELQANVSSEFFFTAHDGIEGAKLRHGQYQAVRHDDNVAEISTSLLTFCVLVLKNGFTVTGESACASPENFNAEIGRRIARENAVQKIWPLMGYELKQRLGAI